MLIYILNMILFALSIYCLIAKRHIIKKIVGMCILDYSVNLFLILLGYKDKGIAPIIGEKMNQQAFAMTAVDPIPQAFVLTSIVIGLGTLAMMAAFSIKLYEKYRTFDMNEINRLRG